MKAWKHLEQRVARYLSPAHGRRTPLSGRNSGHGTSSDILLPPSLPLLVECKHGKAAESLLRSPKRLARLFERVEVLALEEHKVPVIVLHPPRWGGGGVANYPAVVRLERSLPAFPSSVAPAILLKPEVLAIVTLRDVKEGEIAL